MQSRQRALGEETAVRIGALAGRLTSDFLCRESVTVIRRYAALPARSPGPDHRPRKRSRPDEPRERIAGTIAFATEHPVWLKTGFDAPGILDPGSPSNSKLARLSASSSFPSQHRPGIPLKQTPRDTLKYPRGATGRSIGTGSWSPMDVHFPLPDGARLGRRDGVGGGGVPCRDASESVG